MQESSKPAGSADGPPATLPSQGQSGEGGNGKKPPILSIWLDAIYKAYPRHDAPRPAKERIHQALERIIEEQQLEPILAFEYLCGRTRLYATAVSHWPKGDERFIPMPSTWFNQDRYLADESAWVRKEYAPAARDSKRCKLSKGPLPDSAVGPTDKEWELLVAASEEEKVF